jgi:hypothetical protein
MPLSTIAILEAQAEIILDQGWATIFVRGPQYAFMCVPGEDFSQKAKIKAEILHYKVSKLSPYFLYL